MQFFNDISVIIVIIIIITIFFLFKSIAFCVLSAGKIFLN